MNTSSIIEQLEKRIVSGEFKPGGRLPSERVLSKRFACSRQAVREALTQLRSKGVIETRRGSGSTVLGFIESDNRNKTIERLYSRHPQMLFDILEMREILESKAAYFASMRASLKDRYKIEQAYEAMQNNSPAGDAPAAYAAADFAFHKAIAEATQSALLAHTLDGLSRLFAKSVRASADNLLNRASERNKINDQHTAIFEAIMARAPDSAEAAAKQHIESVRASLEKIEREEKTLLRN